MKKIICLVLCFSFLLFAGCKQTPSSVDDVNIYFADLVIDGGYNGKLLTDFDVEEVFDAIDEDDLIADGKETEVLSLLESEYVKTEIQKRIEQETQGSRSVELEQTVRIYLENGDVAVLHTYDVCYAQADVSDPDIFLVTSRTIVVMVK